MFHIFCIVLELHNKNCFFIGFQYIVGLQKLLPVRKYLKISIIATAVHVYLVVVFSLPFQAVKPVLSIVLTCRTNLQVTENLNRSTYFNQGFLGDVQVLSFSRSCS